MRKAIRIDVRLWIEGEDEPAADFAARTTAAVRDIIAAGAERFPDLAVRVQRVRERTD